MRTFFSLTLLIFIAATSSLALVGSKKQAVQAAKDRVEPAYIKTFVEQLTVKIDRFAATKNLKDPNEKLLWLSAMQGVIKDTARFAYNAARDAAPTTDIIMHAFNAASPGLIEQVSSFADRIVGPIMGLHDYANLFWSPDEVQKAAQDATQDAQKNAATDDEIGRIDYEVAKWAVLNWLLDNFEEITSQKHQASLEFARRCKNSPFTSNASLEQFYQNTFGRLSGDLMQFMAPWLIKIIPIEIAGNHEELFRRLRHSVDTPEHSWPSLLQESNLPSLPKEVVKLIETVMPHSF